jgi:hypothetical protein
VLVDNVESRLSVAAVTSSSWPTAGAALVLIDGRSIHTCIIMPNGSLPLSEELDIWITARRESNSKGLSSFATRISCGRCM